MMICSRFVLLLLFVAALGFVGECVCHVEFLQYPPCVTAGPNLAALAMAQGVPLLSEVPDGAVLK